MTCPLTSPISDLDIFVLQPGERIDYSGAGDPSDDYVFHGKGFYRVRLTYTLAPDQHIEIAR